MVLFTYNFTNPRMATQGSLQCVANTTHMKLTNYAWKTKLPRVAVATINPIMPRVAAATCTASTRDTNQYPAHAAFTKGLGEEGQLYSCMQVCRYTILFSLYLLFFFFVGDS